VIKNWRFIPILLTFEKIDVIVISNNITIMILEAIDNYGTPTNKDDLQVDLP
jgi:hypothetical protein